MKNIEERLAVIEYVAAHYHAFNVAMFEMILRQDDAVRLKIVEAIRLMLVHQKSAPLPPTSLQLLQQMRERLLSPISQETTATYQQPTIRPVG